MPASSLLLALNCNVWDNVTSIFLTIVLAWLQPFCTLYSGRVLSALVFVIWRLLDSGLGSWWFWFLNYLWHMRNTPFPCTRNCSLVLIIFFPLESCVFYKIIRVKLFLFWLCIHLLIFARYIHCFIKPFSFLLFRFPPLMTNCRCSSNTLFVSLYTVFA